MYILGLDLSSKSSGYSVFKDGELIDYGAIKSSSKDTMKRMQIMKDGIKMLLNKYSIDIVVCEDVPGGKKAQSNFRTTQVLFNLQGIILMEIYEHNPDIQIELMQSASWRNLIGIKTKGKHKAELKPEDIAYVKEHFGFIPENDDIADAIDISVAYQKRVKGGF